MGWPLPRSKFPILTSFVGSLRYWVSDEQYCWSIKLWDAMQI
jgi:hypothetical protein